VLGPLGAVALGLFQWLAGCSSGSSNGDQGASVCTTVFKGKCGGACKVETDCAAGIYCGAEGTCTADCAPGHACAAGLACDATGRCQAGSVFGGGPGVSGLADGGGACVVDTRRGEGLPADIYIMNDQSQSMSCVIPTGGNRWDAMKNALTGFVNSPGAAGMGVGIQYFGLGGGMGSCDTAVYTPADVEIAPLPGNAQPIITSLSRHQPSTYTPTPAALEGAIAHAKAWSTAHPDHYMAVVLATDGEPNLCGNPNDRIGSVAQAAAVGFSNVPKIPTYVIGIVGGSAANGGRGCATDPAPPNRADLDRVAKAGGTQGAFIVDAATGDTSAQFLDALNKIRGAAVIPCQYRLPASTADKTLALDKVNISFTPAGGAPQALHAALNVAACDPALGGWYYDNPATPTTILLCPATCNLVKADAKAQVDVLLGCRGNGLPPR
jgi:hypothetical protein